MIKDSIEKTLANIELLIKEYSELSDEFFQKKQELNSDELFLWLNKLEEDGIIDTPEFSKLLDNLYGLIH